MPANISGSDVMDASASGLEEGQTATVGFVVSAEDMARYEQLSGDDNPLHKDAAFACARGFERPVVYGGLLIAMISRLLGTRIPGPGCVWQRLEVDFRAPLYTDQEASLTGTVTYCNADLGLARIALEITVDGRVIAKGRAQASLGRIAS